MIQTIGSGDNETNTTTEKTGATKPKHTQFLGGVADTRRETREHSRPAVHRPTVPNYEKFLNELGFIKKDFHDNIKDLHKVLGDIRLAWEQMTKEFRRKSGPPSATISDDRTLTIAPDFSDAYTAFVDYRKNRKESDNE
jgi:hypothetical protein